MKKTRKRKAETMAAAQSVDSDRAAVVPMAAGYGSQTSSDKGWDVREYTFALGSDKKDLCQSYNLKYDTLAVSNADGVGKLTVKNNGRFENVYLFSPQYKTMNRYSAKARVKGCDSVRICASVMYANDATSGKTSLYAVFCERTNGNVTVNGLRSSWSIGVMSYDYNAATNWMTSKYLSQKSLPSTTDDLFISMDRDGNTITLKTSSDGKTYDSDEFKFVLDSAGGQLYVNGSLLLRNASPSVVPNVLGKQRICFIVDNVGNPEIELADASFLEEIFGEGSSSGGEDKPDPGDNPDPGENPGSGDTPETPEPDPDPEPEPEPEPVQPPSFSDFQHVPVSHLEPLPRGFRLSGDELFLVSQPVMKDGKTAGYVSKSIKYSTLARNISVDMKFGVKEDDYGGTVQYVKDVVKDPDHPIPSVISSITEDSKGRITGLGGYALEDAVKQVFSDVVLPNIDGIVLTSQVTSEIGNRTDLVASQKLAEYISSQFGQFVRKDQITNNTGNSTTLVASQKLVGGLSSVADQTFVRKSDVKSVPGSSTTCPASQKFVTDISGVIAKSVMGKLSGWSGDVYYMSVDNVPVMRSMLDISDYVCENQNDIDRTITYMDDLFTGETDPKSFVCSVDLKSGDCGYVFSTICEGGDVPNSSDSVSATCVMGKDMVPKSICINTVGNSTGTARMIGLLTSEKLANYSITLDEFAGNDIQSGQDQVYGFVAAHAVDADGNHHSLIFSRNVDDDGNNGWMVAVDGIGRTDPRQGRLVWKSKTVSSIGDQVVGNKTIKLNDPNARSTLHVTRRGNKIFAYVSSVRESGDKLPPQYIDKSTELIIDLESQRAVANGVFQDHGTGTKDSRLLRLFLGEAEAGFVVMSSSGGKYANCKYAHVTGDMFTRRLRHANWYPNIRIPDTILPDPITSSEAMFLFKEPTPGPPPELNPPPKYVYIIDAENNIKYQRQVGSHTHALTAVTDVDPMNHVGIGRFALNRATNKTFFVTETGFVKVLEYDDD